MLLDDTVRVIAVVLINRSKQRALSVAGATVQVHPGWSVLISGEGMVDDLAGGTELGTAPAGARSTRALHGG